MSTKIEEKIKIALSDPKAPWYGSDLVSWVGDLLEEYAALKKRDEMVQKELDTSELFKRNKKLVDYIEALQEANNTVVNDLKAKNKRLGFCLTFIEEFIKETGDASFHAVASRIREIVRECSVEQLQAKIKELETKVRQ